ncbi:hypothetical protein SEA_PERIWINKLE_18 [Gordonia phage Periwinkle]|nr:hypothetical protein SEA_PERIWINKLE_18 [Gordonia phage Periwinkle]
MAAPSAIDLTATGGTQTAGSSSLQGSLSLVVQVSGQTPVEVL